MLHILKSPLNLKRARSYKVRYIALSILRTLSSLQGESQVNVFHLLVAEIGHLPFYKHGFLKLHLVLQPLSECGETDGDF